MPHLDSEALLAALTTAQQRFIEQENVQGLFNALLDVLLELTKSEYGFIGEVRYDRDEPYLKTHAITNIAWNETTRHFYETGAPKGLEFTNLKTLFGQVIVTQAPVIANDPANDPRRGGLPEGHPAMRAFLGLPFFADNRLNGMVGIANRPGGYDEQICQELAPLLATCAALIEGYRHLQKRQEYRTRLEAMVTSLEEANEELGSFAYRTSHDLRGPLVSSIGLLDLIEHGVRADEPELALAALGQTREALGSLEKLVRDILSLTQVRHASNEVEDIDLVELVEAQWQQACQQQGGVLVSLERCLSVQRIRANRIRLEHVVYNLMSNAIKYRSPDASPPSLALTVSADGEEVCFCFEDNGLGIPAEYHHEMFTMFRRFHPRHSVGSGLGLYLIRKSVRSMGGSVSYTLLTPGSRFEVRLPQEPVVQEH